MCGRTALTATPQDLRDVFGLEQTPLVEPHFNVPPSRPVAVVRRKLGAPGRTLDWMPWGLVPCWAKDRTIASKLALARAESVTTSHAFRNAIHERRCLVVVDGFYEWRREGKHSPQPFFVRLAGRAPFALAGLWERWIGGDGEILETCAIITQASRPPLSAIHDRMPLILERDDWDRWLDPSVVQTDAVVGLLAARSPALVAHPVDTYVNDPRHDDPRCIEPWQPAQGRLFA